MLAIFELQNTDLDGAPLFIKGMMEINFRNTPDGTYLDDLILGFSINNKLTR